MLHWRPFKSIYWDTINAWRMIIYFCHNRTYHWWVLRSGQNWGNQDNLGVSRFKSFLHYDEWIVEWIMQFLIILMWIEYIDIMILITRTGWLIIYTIHLGSLMFQLLYCRIFGIKYMNYVLWFRVIQASYSWTYDL